MPSTFDDFGVHFLYPDNWQIQARDADDECESVTLEMPNGGFFSVTKYRHSPAIQDVLEGIASAMKSEYPEAEIEETEDDDADIMEMRFYYLDLLIIARVTAMVLAKQTVVVQIQAESRAFDAGEPVFNAMLKSIRDGMTGPAKS